MKSVRESGVRSRPLAKALSGVNLKGIIYVSVDINYC